MAVYDETVMSECVLHGVPAHTVIYQGFPQGEVEVVVWSTQKIRVRKYRPVTLDKVRDLERRLKADLKTDPRDIVAAWERTLG